MKTNPVIFPLVLALVATLAATGCKHGPTRVTPLPGARTVVGNPPELPPTVPFNPNDGNPNVKTGGIDTQGLDTFDGMKMDRTAFAAQTVHFAFDSAVVKKSEAVNVAAVASALAATASNKLLIEGHCDERGTQEYNRALGERRALALREALAKAGVSPDRIRTLSFGKDKPVDPSHDDAAWTKNRRGEFILLLPNP